MINLPATDIILNNNDAKTNGLNASYSQPLYVASPVPVKPPSISSSGDKFNVFIKNTICMYIYLYVLNANLR